MQCGALRKMLPVCLHDRGPRGFLRPLVALKADSNMRQCDGLPGDPGKGHEESQKPRREGGMKPWSPRAFIPTVLGAPCSFLGPPGSPSHCLTPLSVHIHTFISPDDGSVLSMTKQPFYHVLFKHIVHKLLGFSHKSRILPMQNLPNQ